MREIQILKNNNVKFSGVIHVGAHRGEELSYYEEDFCATQAVFIEPNPEVFDELKFIEMIWHSKDIWGDALFQKKNNEN